MMRKFILLLSIIGLGSCSTPTNSTTDEKNVVASVSSTIRFKVNHYRQTAEGLYSRLVLVVQEGSDIGSDKWTNFYDPIEGFNYESGFVYNLDVIKTEIKNPPQDGSSFNYKLKEIVSREKMGQDVRFEIGLKKHYDDSNSINYVTGDRQTGFKILDQIPMDCASLCPELEQKLATSNNLKGVFKHLEGNQILLTNLISE